MFLLKQNVEIKKINQLFQVSNNNANNLCWRSLAQNCAISYSKFDFFQLLGQMTESMVSNTTTDSEAESTPSDQPMISSITSSSSSDLYRSGLF